MGDKYPQILIKGANYDPPGINFYLSKLILGAKLLFILIIVSSYDIWGSLGQAIPRWYTWCTENKIYACMMIFFVGNMLESQVSSKTKKNNNLLASNLYFLIEQQLIASGAFEISINDIPVWSKLETGRIPSPQELFNIIDSHIKVFDKVTVHDFNE